MSKRITKRQARETMRKVVEAAGERHFVKQCLYVKQGRRQPYCIIGHLLHELGVPLDDLRKHEGSTAMHVVRKFFPNTSAVVLDALTVAQTVQDADQPWGDAEQAFLAVLDGRMDVHKAESEWGRYGKKGASAA